MSKNNARREEEPALEALPPSSGDDRATAAKLDRKRNRDLGKLGHMLERVPLLVDRVPRRMDVVVAVLKGRLDRESGRDADLAPRGVVRARVAALGLDGLDRGVLLDDGRQVGRKVRADKVLDDPDGRLGARLDVLRSRRSRQ